MKHTLTKTLTFLLALVFLLSLAVACDGQETTTAPDGTTTTKADTGTTGTTGTTSESTSEEEPVVISMIKSENNPPPNPENSVLKEIQNRTGYIFQVDVVSAEDYQTKLGALIASKDLPDILGFNLSNGEQYRDNDLILELTDLLSEFGPVILEDKGDGLTVGLNAEDSIWGIPYGNIYPSNLSVRTDWLENVDMEMPTDTESLYDVLYAFTYDDPNQSGSQDTVGIGITMEMLKTTTHIFGAFGVPIQENVQLEDGTVTTYMRHENFLDAIKYFRKLYQDGIMETEFATIPWVPCVEKLWNGSYGMFDFQAVGTTNNWLGRYTEDPIPTFDFAVIAGPGGPGGAVEPRRSNYWGITSNCKHPEDAMKLANYMTTEEGDELLYFGIEGKHYQWIDKEEGTFEYLPPYDDSATQRNDGAFIYWSYFVPNNNNAEIRTLNPKTRYSLDLAFDNLLPDAHIYGALEADKEYGTTLDEIVEEAIANLIVTTGDVDAEYQASVGRWLAEGGEVWEEEATRVYAEENPN
jgi:putative aldouronate transport system substrate-binding protein